VVLRPGVSDSFGTVRTHKSIVPYVVEKCPALCPIRAASTHTEASGAPHDQRLHHQARHVQGPREAVERIRHGEGLFSGAAAAPAKCDILLGDCHLPCQAGSCIRPTHGLHPVTLRGWVRITPWSGSCCGCVWPESVRVRDIDGNHPVHNEADPSQVESYHHLIKAHPEPIVETLSARRLLVSPGEGRRQRRRRPAPSPPGSAGRPVEPILAGADLGVGPLRRPGVSGVAVCGDNQRRGAPVARRRQLPLVRARRHYPRLDYSRPLAVRVATRRHRFAVQCAVHTGKGLPEMQHLLDKWRESIAFKTLEARNSLLHLALMLDHRDRGGRHPQSFEVVRDRSCAGIVTWTGPSRSTSRSMEAQQRLAWISSAFGWITILSPAVPPGGRLSPIDPTARPALWRHNHARPGSRPLPRGWTSSLPPS
jgi:hypothetical protein